LFVRFLSPVIFFIMYIFIMHCHVRGLE
jgi:hypothetical protein